MHTFISINHFLSQKAIWGGMILLFFTLTGCKEKLPETEPIQVTKADLRTPEGFREPGDSPLFESFRRLERENWQKPQLVISRLGDIHDKTIVDIGAGTGYFTLRLAEKAEKVIATDIDQRFLDYISTSLGEGRRQNYLDVETRLTLPENPGIKPNEADIVFIVNTYHLIENRQDYFRKVHAGLKQEGSIFIVDFKKKPLPVGPDPSEKVDVKQVFRELEEAGFYALKVDSSTLDFQYIITGR